jgi:hypothetical protein
MEPDLVASVLRTLRVRTDNFACHPPWWTSEGRLPLSQALTGLRLTFAPEAQPARCLPFPSLREVWLAPNPLSLTLPHTTAPEPTEVMSG